MPRILIVDDDPATRRNLRLTLTKHRDWNVSEAENAKTAIEKVRQEQPEIVLLDVLMSSGNGIMVAYEIRQVAPKTQIVFITDKCRPEEASAVAHLLGSGEFVDKSQLASHLLPTIKRVLKGSTEEEPLPESGLLPARPPTLFTKVQKKAG